MNSMEPKGLGNSERARWEQWTEQLLQPDRSHREVSGLFSTQVRSQSDCEALVRWAWNADKSQCTHLHARLVEASRVLRASGPNDQDHRVQLELLEKAAQGVPEWKGESVEFENPTDRMMYARVYAHYPSLFGGTYEPRSEIIQIEPGSTANIEYAHGGEDRRVYYTTASEIRDVAHAHSKWLPDDGPFRDIVLFTRSFGRSYNDPNPLVERPQLEQKGEKVLVSNRRHYAVYVRAYETSDKGCVQPTSSIVKIPANSAHEIPIASGGGERRIYYTPDVNSVAEAKTYLRDNGSFHWSVRVFLNHSDSFKITNKVTKTAPVVIHENQAMPVVNTAFQVAVRKLAEPQMATKVEQIRAAHQRKQREADANHGFPTVAVSRDPSGDISVSDREADYTRRRDVTCHAAMRQIWKEVHPDRDLPEDCAFPRAGVAGSGGGLRAMLTLEGFLAGLHQEGLFDAISFISGTSGSTWAMGDLIANGGDPKVLADLPRRVATGLRRGVYATRSLDEVMNPIMSMQAERRAKDVDPTSLLYDWAVGLQTTALSGVRAPDDAGAGLQPLHSYELDPLTTPLPIFNFVETTRTLDFVSTESKMEPSGDGRHSAINFDTFKASYFHDKWEMTPFDATAIPAKDDRGTREACRVPTAGLNREYDERGIAKLDSTTPVPISLLSTMATAGSALTAGLAEAAANSTAALMASAVADIAVKSLTGRDDINIFPYSVTLRRQPGTDLPRILNEPYSGPIQGLPIVRPTNGRAGRLAILRDAGFDYNLPVGALARQARECGIAILCDASGDLNESPGEALFLAIKDAETFGRRLPIEFTDRELFDQKVKGAIAKKEFPIVFGDPNRADEFCIVYVPSVMRSFDPGLADLHRGNWGKYDPTVNVTMKLQYEPRESSMLHDFGRRLGREVSPRIKEVMAQRIQAMNQQ